MWKQIVVNLICLENIQKRIFLLHELKQKSMCISFVWANTVLIYLNKSLRIAYFKQT